MFRDGARSSSSKDPNKGKLLNDIETVNNSHHFDKSHSTNTSPITRRRSKSVDKGDILKSKSKHVNDDLATKDKKSFWNWKPIKAFTNVKHRRFNCSFNLEVHRIEELPSKFDGLELRVHWETKGGEAVTKAVEVNKGIAEFREILTHTCSVHGSKSGSHHSVKYDSKHFVLYAAVRGNPKLDIGKHHFDLTRLLPLTLEELDDGKSTGTWVTSFKLSGEAKGATMSVTFRYVVLREGIAQNNKNVLQLLDLKTPAINSVKFNQREAKSLASMSMEDIVALHEDHPARMTDFSNAVNILFQKLDEEQADSLVDVKHEIVFPADDSGPSKGHTSAEKGTDVEKIAELDEKYNHEHEHSKHSECSPSNSYIVSESEASKSPCVEKGTDVEMVADVDEKYDHVHEPSKHSECSPSDSYTVSEGEVSKSPCVEKGTDVETVAELDEKYDNVHEPSKHSECSPSNSYVVSEGEVSKSPFAEKELEAEELEEKGENIIDEQDGKSPEHTGAHNDIEVAAHEESDTVGNELIHDSNSDVKDVGTKESLLEDLESVWTHVAELEKDGIDTTDAESEIGDLDNRNTEEPTQTSPPRNFDNLANTNESLNALEVKKFSLSFNSDVESPRERLLRDFLKEAEATGCSLIGSDIDEDDDADDIICYAPPVSEAEEFSDDSDSVPVVVDQSEYPKIRARVMDDPESQDFPEEWNYDEKAFLCSSPYSITELDSRVFVPPEAPPLPPVGEGLGSLVKTKTGGYLCSMNPALFPNAESGRSLIMQVSRPVVVPAKLGSSLMDILQKLASMGLEKLSVEAKKIMPLDDITGTTVHQMTWEAVPVSDAINRGDLMRSEREASSSPKQTKSIDSEYSSLEELVPLAMNKIEELSVEGLRIQSGMSDEEAPSCITAPPIEEFPAVEGKRVGSPSSVGLEGIAGLQLLDIKDAKIKDDEGDKLMGFALTLDEWVRLDSGQFDENQSRDWISKLLDAHHANSKDFSRRCGLLGDNFNVALMVQLRDPLRNYEPVGTPMLGLIQVKRTFSHPNPTTFAVVAETTDRSDEDDDEGTPEVESVPEFKICEVHVAGFEAEPGKKKPWGNAAQQQSGSRWLVANGMGKGNNKNHAMRPKIVSKYPLPSTITSQPGDTLWSISARCCGTGAKWKELAALNPHIRNPNVILFNETIKLR